MLNAIKYDTNFYHCEKWDEVIDYFKTNPPKVKNLKFWTEFSVQFFSFNEGKKFTSQTYFQAKCTVCSSPIAFAGYNTAWNHAFKCRSCREAQTRESSRKSSRTYRLRHKLVKATILVPCPMCNERFMQKRCTKKYCSNKCRQRAYRAK